MPHAAASRTRCRRASQPSSTASGCGSPVTARAAGEARTRFSSTTIYRRWPSKGELIVDCLLDAFGPAPLAAGNRAELLTAVVRWAAARIGEPGVGDAFAGVFSDAVSDPALRRVLSSRLQDPYRLALQEALGEPENRVLFFVDVVVGALLHRMGMTGEPMVDADVTALAEIGRGPLRGVTGVMCRAVTSARTAESRG
jgi:AcrR family transcriptional regulator